MQCQGSHRNWEVKIVMEHEKLATVREFYLIWIFLFANFKKSSIRVQRQHFLTTP